MFTSVASFSQVKIPTSNLASFFYDANEGSSFIDRSLHVQNGIITNSGSLAHYSTLTGSYWNFDGTTVNTNFTMPDYNVQSMKKTFFAVVKEATPAGGQGVNSNFNFLELPSPPGGRRYSARASNTGALPSLPSGFFNIYGDSISTIPTTCGTCTFESPGEITLGRPYLGGTSFGAGEWTLVVCTHNYPNTQPHSQEYYFNNALRYSSEDRSGTTTVGGLLTMGSTTGGPWLIGAMGFYNNVALNEEQRTDLYNYYNDIYPLGSV
jgi:hypothetical protein